MRTANLADRFAHSPGDLTFTGTPAGVEGPLESVTIQHRFAA